MPLRLCLHQALAIALHQGVSLEGVNAGGQTLFANRPGIVPQLVRYLQRALPYGNQGLGQLGVEIGAHNLEATAAPLFQLLRLGGLQLRLGALPQRPPTEIKE